MLEPKDDAPRVTARNQDGETVEPDFSTPTVVYFYPKDDSPSCSVETKQFDEQLSAYSDVSIEVFGVSTDGVDSHKQFHSKYQLDFDLLADENGEIADAFGVNTADGTAERVTFVIDKDTIKRVYTGVDPDGHADEVIKELIEESLTDTQ